MPSTETPPTDSYLRIRRLTKRFGEFTALADISLDVLEGEFVCFLGPSGCGKTTLLRAIAGLDIQTAGTIEQAGADISALPPSERDFGIVFQSYALFPNMTVARNVAYGLESRRRPREEVRSRVRALLDLVGLPDQGGKYPAQLSGGQQQRIALARAIAMSPGLLLLDEPLSALDAKVRARLRHEVKALQRRLGITTIMVTHDQEEALTMADRIVVMNHGVIEQVGAPAGIYREPASVFVADFIGTMNFLAAEVTEEAAAGDGEVRAGGLVLACDTSGHSRGERVTAAIRPEDIVLLGAEPTSRTSPASSPVRSEDIVLPDGGGARDPGTTGDTRHPGSAEDHGNTRGSGAAEDDRDTHDPGTAEDRRNTRGSGSAEGGGDTRGSGAADDGGKTRDSGAAENDVAADRSGGIGATVEYVEFLGSFARVELASAGVRLRMDLPIAQVQRFDLAAGSAVRAMVPPGAVRIYAGAPPDG